MQEENKNSIDESVDTSVSATEASHDKSTVSAAATESSNDISNGDMIDACADDEADTDIDSVTTVNESAADGCDFSQDGSDDSIANNVDMPDAEGDKAEGDKSRAKKNSKLVSELFEWAEMIVVSFCAVVLVFSFLIRPAVVVGDSMIHTLHNTDTLLISPLASEYEYKDIVVFQIPENIGKAHGDAIVKRVIATEGQWVDVNLYTWEVYVADSEEELKNAEPLSEPYVNFLSNRGLSAAVDFPLQVPKGCLFVMGDNRSDSYDSRHFGCIKEEYVMGKVVVRLMPLNKFGKVD